MQDDYFLLIGYYFLLDKQKSNHYIFRNQSEVEMKKNNKRSSEVKIESVPVKDIATELNEKQSVRTTFKMMPEAFDSLEWITEHFNISVKSAVDFVCDLVLFSETKTDILNIIVESAKLSKHNDAKSSYRKTLVVSKGAVKRINALTKEHGVSRNALLERGIIVFKPLIEKSIEQEREKVKKAEDIIQNFSKAIYETERELIDLFEGEHELVTAFQNEFLFSLHMIEEAIGNYLNSGIPIDPDNLGGMPS